MTVVKLQNKLAEEKKPIDLRGIHCPMNVVRIKLSLEKIEQGDCIEFLLDDGDPVLNVTKTLIAQGHKILSQTQEATYCALLVEKG